jgi:hypothetical protein
LTEEGMPSEEELREQIRQLTIDDVLLQTVVTLINLSGRRLTAEDDEKDPEQGKKGIDAARALLPMLPQEQVGPIKDALSQLQMIYVKETGGRPQPQAEQAPEEAEREQARSKLWTPPGT